MGQYYELPIAVAATGTFDRMSNGYAHSCGLDSTTNQLWCWGNNDYGQRGGVAPSNYDPISISGTTLTELASGYHVNCGVTTGGARRCWGLNDSAQIGNGGTSVPVTTPTTVTEALSSWTRLAMGEQHGCGLAAGALHCWGYNSAGQTGQTAGASPVTAPAAVADPTPGTTDSWIALSGGALHTCGVLSTNGTSGQIYCWGYNGRGQLGFGGSGGATLVAISSPTDFVEVAAGYAHTCGRRATGQLHCWGSNDQGELGDNTVYERASIGTPIAGASDWVAVDVGQYISCGIRGADRRLYCWGENRYGQAGTGGTLRWMPGPVNAP
jgi:alpha-tubulin suppressor-like RCC1 family protein